MGDSDWVVAYLRGAVASLRSLDGGADTCCRRHGPHAIDTLDNWVAALRRPSWKKDMMMPLRRDGGCCGGELSVPKLTSSTSDEDQMFCCQKISPPFRELRDLWAHLAGPTSSRCSLQPAFHSGEEVGYVFRIHTYPYFRPAGDSPILQHQNPLEHDVPFSRRLMMVGQIDSMPDLRHSMCDNGKTKKDESALALHFCRQSRFPALLSMFWLQVWRSSLLSSPFFVRSSKYKVLTLPKFIFITPPPTRGQASKSKQHPSLILFSSRRCPC